MPPFVRIPAVLRRSLILTATAIVALVVFAGSSAAAVAGAGTGVPVDGAALSNASHGATLIGVSVGTLAWASVGLLLLVVGLFAASRSGHRVPTAAMAGSFQVVPGHGIPAATPSSLEPAPELSSGALAVS